MQKMAPPPHEGRFHSPVGNPIALPSYLGSCVACDCPLVLGLAATRLPPGWYRCRRRWGRWWRASPARSDPTQTYTLYLPPGFDAVERWPVLLIFDPRGRSVLAAELFREAADTYGWILVSSDNTRSDGPMEPNVVALRALWPEVHTRLPAQFDRIYTAGFSGGAAVAYVLSRSTHEVAGIIACGGRFLPDELEGNAVPIFSTAGDTDFNFHEMHEVDALLAEAGQSPPVGDLRGAPHLDAALGGERGCWAGSRLWPWRQISDLRTPNLVDVVYTADASLGGEALESDGQLIAAARRYREMTATYRRAARHLCGLRTRP